MTIFIIMASIAQHLFERLPLAADFPSMCMFFVWGVLDRSISDMDEFVTEFPLF